MMMCISSRGTYIVEVHMYIYICIRGDGHLLISIRNWSSSLSINVANQKNKPTFWGLFSHLNQQPRRSHQFHREYDLQDI